MHTTLELEEDVFQAATEIARQQGISIGRVVSDLARQTLARQQSRTQRNGVPLFPIQPTASIVTLEVVNQLRDESP